MIKTQSEYLRLKEQLAGERERMAQQRQVLIASGLDPQRLELAMAPLKAFAVQLEAEVNFYERIVAGDFSLLTDFQSIGRLLIAMRIASGLSRAELARRLGQSASQVTRDEQDEYYGASSEKIRRIFDVLGFRADIHVRPKDADGALAAG